MIKKKKTSCTNLQISMCKPQNVMRLDHGAYRQHVQPRFMCSRINKIERRDETVVADVLRHT